jgi:predicted metalloprotease with PDZ domain
MNVNYKLKILDPKDHILHVAITGTRPDKAVKSEFFLPSWSPGSYLMREYSRNIRNFQATDSKGKHLDYRQIEKGTWEVNWNDEVDNFQITYEVYCHLLTVRNSFIDEAHAFLHGPTIFMGIVDQELTNIEIAIEFPTIWSKITTGLKDISKVKEKFVYHANDYDELLDTPIEIGCHETDGFMVGGKEHELAFFGKLLPSDNNLKKDIKKIVEYISNLMGEIPYDRYVFISHFLPGIYGGLEHRNSTALQFSSLAMSDRKGYIKWLSLVSHEYFHTWNVKRIRPHGLSRFDYRNENYTSMLWLAEGLTSFCDELFVYRCGLCTLEEYLGWQKENLNNYIDIPGKRFDSLEMSSFNAWIKLYRPDDNSINSSISYYLKGGIVFFVLNTILVKFDKKVDDLIKMLWDHYNRQPEVGVTSVEVFKMIEDLSDTKTREKFETMIQTTEDVDFESCLDTMGVKVVWEETPKMWLGVKNIFEGDRVIMKTILIDGPAYKGGLNAGDELIAVNDIRITKSNYDEMIKSLKANQTYQFTISRKNLLSTIGVNIEKSPRSIKELKVIDETNCDKFLM